MDPVARRYAQALYQQAAETAQADAVEADVALVGETLAGSRDLAAALTSPAVPRHKKLAVLTAVFEGRVSALTLQFLRLLVEKQREALLPEVVEAAAQLRDARSGVVEADVRTARPLSADDAERLSQALAVRFGHAVRLRLSVDPDLIGGLVVRVGDVVYDRSVRHQLASLRERLTAPAAVSAN